MSFEDTLRAWESVYVIPRGCKNVKDVIRIKSGSTTRVEVFFPHESYQVITDNNLKERRIDLQTYIRETEAWRK